MQLNKARELLVKEILKVLEGDEIPFTSKWLSPEKNYNIVSKQSYRGINQFLLSLISSVRKLDDPRWLTFNQAKKNGYTVKKGAKGVPVEFWSYYDIKEKEKISSQEAKVRLQIDGSYKDNLKAISNVYYVFNASDVSGIPPLKKEQVKEFENVHSLAFNVLETYLENEQVRLIHKGHQAFYNPSKDEIVLPQKTAFKTEYNYLSTLAHEVCHSTGNEKRLDREIQSIFGTPKYALEELRAEISASFLCSDLEVESTELDIQNHKSYIQSWIQIITDTPVELFKAINESQNICDYVLEKGEFEKTKIMGETLGINELLDSFNYLDIEEQIELFYFVQQQSSLFKNIEFVDENGSFYEIEEEAEKISEYVEDVNNQKELVRWVFNHGGSFDTLINQNKSNYIEKKEDFSLELER